MNQNNVKSCSKCNINDIDWDLEKPHLNCSKYCHCLHCEHRRIFEKNREYFCFNCLASEYSVNCHVCHKRINSKEELLWWDGVRFESDGFVAKLDHHSFRCLGCNDILYKVNKINHIEGLRGEAQKWWDTLSGVEREKELARVVENMKQGKYWASEVAEGSCAEAVSLGNLWQIKNGKLVSSSPHLAPLQIIEEFLEKEFGKDVTRYLILRSIWIKENCEKNDKGNSPSPNPTTPTPQPITGSNDKSDNSVQSANSPPTNSEPDRSLEIKVVSNDNNQLDSKPNEPPKGKKDNNQMLVINLKEIKKISLAGDNLVIEFKQSAKTQNLVAEQINNSRELTQVKNYLQTTRQASVEGPALANIINQKTDNAGTNPAPTSENWFGWGVGVGMVGMLAVAGLWLLIVKTKKSRLKK